MDVRWIIITFLATNTGISRADLVLQPEGGVHVQFTKDNFMITCSALGKETTKLRWYDPSGDEITNSRGRIHIEQPSNVALMLVWLEAKREDAGTYKCTGDADGDEISFELIVYGPISFAKVQHEQRGKEGSNITVVCDAESEPSPSISWKFKEVSLPLSQDTSDIKHEAVGNELKIYNLKREDAGNYTCCAMFITELISQVEYTNITVQVEYLPEWNNEIAEKSYSGIGHLANLTCEAEAEPSPIFEWRKNEETLQASNLYTIFSYHNMTVLQVSVYNESLFGGYDCIATNPVGSVSRRVFLEEGDAPNAPSVAVVSDEPGTLTLDIAPPADNMLEVTGYKVEYKLPSESWNNVQAIEFERGHQYMLKNLSHDTEYVVRVAARNMVGYGEYSNEITTRTKNLISDSVNDSAFSSQSSAIAALLSTSVLLWVLRL